MGREEVNRYGIVHAVPKGEITNEVGVTLPNVMEWPLRRPKARYRKAGPGALAIELRTKRSKRKLSEEVR